MYDGSRGERSGQHRPLPPGRKLWRFVKVAVSTVAAVASTAVLANAVGGGRDDRSPASVRPLGAADMVLHHGKISTVDKDNTTVEAIAVRDGEILATGSNKKVMRLIGRGTKVINLKGRRVLPGLIDGHLHGMREGYHCWTQVVRLDLITSRAEALAAYADKATELPDGRWIWTTFGGWSVTQLDDPRIFTFDELTAAAPNNPVWITGGGFTGPRVNQAALNTLGLTAASPGVQVDADGKPTGLLTGEAGQAANAAILAQLDALGIDAEAKCLADFIAEANSRGLTAWKDAGGNTAPWSTIGAINEGLHSQEPTMQLYRDGGLNARIAYHDMANAYTAGALEREKTLTENAVGFLGDDMFRYLGQGEDMMATMADYNEYAKYAATKRLSVETHVGGPIDAILNGFEIADAIHPVGTLKWRIAHPENGQPSDAQLARGRELGIGWALTFSSVRTGGTGPRYHTTMENSDHMCLAVGRHERGRLGAVPEPLVRHLRSHAHPGRVGRSGKRATFAAGCAAPHDRGVRLVHRPGEPSRVAGAGPARGPDRPQRRLLRRSGRRHQGPALEPHDRGWADRARRRRVLERRLTVTERPA